MTIPSAKAPPILVKLHRGPLTGRLAGFPNSTSTIALIADNHGRTAELVLWSVDAIEEHFMRVTITMYQPTPVLVILAASMRPTSTHIALCLDLGALQCLVEPTDHELVAHINAIARRLRHPPERGAAT